MMTGPGVCPATNRSSSEADLKQKVNLRTKLMICQIVVKLAAYDDLPLTLGSVVEVNEAKVSLNP